MNPLILERLLGTHPPADQPHRLSAAFANRTSWQKVQQLSLETPSRQARGVIGTSALPRRTDTFKAIVDGYAGWDFCQIQYNYMDEEYQAGKTGLQYAASRGLAVIVMEPLRGGKLALSLPAAQPLWDAHPVKRSPADWALQWVWSQPQVTLALSGMTTMQQLEENIVSASASQPGLLTGADLALLERVREALKSLSPIPCTSCEYCPACRASTSRTILNCTTRPPCSAMLPPAASPTSALWTRLRALRSASSATNACPNARRTSPSAPGCRWWSRCWVNQPYVTEL